MVSEKEDVPDSDPFGLDLGVSAACLGHELRNALTGVRGCLELARRGPLLDEETTGHIDVALSELERCVRLSQRLMQLRPVVPAPGRCDAALVARECLATVKPQAKRHQVAASLTGPESGLQVAVPSDALKQMLLNLACNALEAMPSGGRLTLNLCEEITPVATKRVVITVADTGRELDAAALRGLFEPSLTTKAAVGGAELGLYVASRLAVSYGGTLETLSADRQGAVFALRLPAYAEGAVPCNRETGGN